MFIIGTLTSCVTLGKYRDMESRYYRSNGNLNKAKGELNNLTEQYNNVVSIHNKNVEKYNKLTNSYNDLESKYKDVIDKNKKNEADIYRLNNVKDSLSRECKMSDIDRKIPVGNEKNDSTYVCIIATGAFRSAEEDFFYDRRHEEDAELFKKYCENILNINQTHIIFYKNAHSEDIKTSLISIKDSSTKHNGKINIIFYIAAIESGKAFHYDYLDDVFDNISLGYYGDEDKNYINDTVLWMIDKEYNKVCYSLKWLYDELHNINAKQIVCFMDIKRASSSNRFFYTNSAFEQRVSAWEKDDSQNKKIPRTIFIKPKENDTLQDIETNVVVFLSSKEKETSYEMPYEGHGMFAYFLMKKIKQSKGNITLGNLYEYISVNVKQSAEDFLGIYQTPTVVTYPDKNYNWKSLKLCNW